MQKLSMEALVRQHVTRAAETDPGRSSETVYGGHEHTLRQTLIALRGATEMSEHESPGEATVLVLQGRIRLHAGGASWDGMPGDLLIVPPDRHSVEALEDSAFLLTVAKATEG